MADRGAMGATRLEYRYRFWIQAVIFLLGFWSPWVGMASLEGVPGFTANSVWLVGSTMLSRQGWLTFGAATVVLLAVALLCTGAGALLRVWGAAFVGSGVVHARGMQGAAMMADGPYRRTRNPLYLGTLLHAVGICLLMPPSGAVLAVALLWLFQVRLALAEEPFLEARFGRAYAAYRAAVPRFLPAPTPQVAAGGERPRWLQGALGEIYFVGAFAVLAAFGWGFNAEPIRRGLLISLGVWLIALALLPREAVRTQSVRG